ncbi:hypothetical protein F5B18DRAFT_261767 [Nemania serpens]|nr:hypothetical protein F5B18DRAFT_261767 [Nemania serpens]
MAQNAQNLEIASAEIQPPPPAYTDGKQTSSEQDNVHKGGPAPAISPAISPAHLIQQENAEGYVSQNTPQIAREGDQRRVTPLAGLTSETTWIDCPHCHSRAKTRIDTEGTGAQINSGIYLMRTLEILCPLEKSNDISPNLQVN